MYHRPQFDLGTLVLATAIFIGLLVSGTLLASCTTTRPYVAAPVGQHEHSHSSHTKLAEPYTQPRR